MSPLERRFRMVEENPQILFDASKRAEQRESFFYQNKRTIIIGGIGGLLLLGFFFYIRTKK